MIDTHCHLDMDAFAADRQEVLGRALAAGLEMLITIGSTMKSSHEAVRLALEHPSVHATVGIHPHDAKDYRDEHYGQLKELAGRKKVVAIGETGLDYHYDNSPRSIQRQVFATHLALARETGKPAVVHTREAQEDTLAILKESGIRKAVIHCFSGTQEMAEVLVSMGFYLSFSGIVTYKKAQELRQAAAIVPDDLLLIETDAPYLAPVPFRGKRNEPSFIVHTARTIATLRGITEDDLDRITTINAKRLFQLAPLSQEGAVAYRIRDSLYLNITNRCTNTCTFCVRFQKDTVKGHHLHLTREPAEEEIIAAIGDPAPYKEVVFCGYGEPLIRVDTVKAVAGWIKDKGGRVRINTNGHGNLIHHRNIVTELKGLVDSISVSLDAQDEETYNNLCQPAIEGAYEGVVAFLKEAKKYIPEVTASVVNANGVDVDKCRAIAQELGVQFRVRTLDVVG